MTSDQNKPSAQEQTSTYRIAEYGNGTFMPQKRRETHYFGSAGLQTIPSEEWDDCMSLGYRSLSEAQEYVRSKQIVKVHHV